MKTAFIHDWLVTHAGAENVLEQMLYTYPKSDLFTLFYDRKTANTEPFSESTITASFMQNIPLIQKIYRKIPQVFPYAVEEFDLRAYDVVVSSSHAVAKGVLTDAKTCHISYIHTPMRYIWDLTFDYLKQANPPKIVEMYMKSVFHHLRTWDKISADRPDFLVANSEFIRRRIQKIYRRDAEVIYPPVSLSDKIYTQKQDYFVTASRHVPYKNIPLIAESFAGMPDKKLIVLGDGSDSKKVQAIADRSPNIEYLGYQNRENLMKIIGEAKAFVFAAEEDFGIMPVEAQSLGTPVIAYGQGGTRETILEGKTGLFFAEQTTSSIQEAVKYFDENTEKFDPNIIAEWTQKFSDNRFKQEFQDCVERSYTKFLDTKF